MAVLSHVRKQLDCQQREGRVIALRMERTSGQEGKQFLHVDLSTHLR